MILVTHKFSFVIVAVITHELKFKYPNSASPSIGIKFADIQIITLIVAPCIFYVFIK